MIYPDLGAQLLGQGLDGVSLSYFDVPNGRLSLVRPGLFTFTVNLIQDGVEYAASFDLGDEHVAEIAAQQRNRNGEFVVAALRGLRPGQSLDIAHDWTAHLTARLGSPEQGTRELFVPLIVESAS